MSRSCHSATFSSAGITAARTIRARPVRFSVRIGLRLCGIADEPFWPGEKYSSASRTSVRCRWRISMARRSIELAMHAEGGEEHRRGGRAGSPASRSARPPGPSSRPRAARPPGRWWRRCRRRRRWRRSRSRAALRPAGRGCAATRRRSRRASGRRWWARRGCRGCGRCVGVSLCSKARRFSAASSASRSASRMSAARAELHGEAGVEHVGRGHPLVDEARLGADVLGEVGEEGDDVVLGLALDLVDARDLEGAALPHRLRPPRAE